MEKTNTNSKLAKFLNSEFALFIKDLIIILIIVLIIRLFIAMPFQISWSSMLSSYYNKEFIIVDRISYYLWNPKRWDVIVFKPYVNQNKEYFLKRIIWVPGDTLKIEGGKIFIKTQNSTEYVEINEPYLNSENLWRTFVWNDDWTHEYALWKDNYFVIWDNRNHSTDSRECFSKCNERTPFVSKSDMIWKVFLDLWYFNLSKMRFISDTWEDTTPKFFNSYSTHTYPELN